MLKGKAVQTFNRLYLQLVDKRGGEREGSLITIFCLKLGKLLCKKTHMYYNYYHDSDGRGVSKGTRSGRVFKPITELLIVLSASPFG